MTPVVDRLRRNLTPLEQVLGGPGLFPGQAAVLALITDHPTAPALVFTRRATHMRSHAGEVAFPGGKWEPQDRDLLATALRETHEEIDLPATGIQILGACSPGATLRGTPVTPFVGLIADSSPMTPDPSELDSIFRVPLHWFCSERQERVDVFSRGKLKVEVPAYRYERYEIWGFTAAVTQEILSLGLPR